MKRPRLVSAVLVGVALLLITVVAYLVIPPMQDTHKAERHLEKIVFGVLPYLDHTYAILGKELGWFAEAGIDIALKEVRVKQIVPWLKNGTVDVCSTPPGILMSAWDSAPNLVSFVFGNLFTWYAIMAQYFAFSTPEAIRGDFARNWWFFSGRQWIIF